MKKPKLSDFTVSDVASDKSSEFGEPADYDELADISNPGFAAIKDGTPWADVA